MEELEKLKIVREKMEKQRSNMTEKERLQNLVNMVKNAESFAIENNVDVIVVDDKEENKWNLFMLH